MGRIHTPHGIIDTPGFVAVGTNAALKAVDGPWADAEGQQLMFCVSAVAGFGSRHSGKRQCAAACAGDVSVCESAEPHASRDALQIMPPTCLHRFPCRTRTTCCCTRERMWWQQQEGCTPS